MTYFSPSTYKWQNWLLIQASDSFLNSVEGRWLLAGCAITAGMLTIASSSDQIVVSAEWKLAQAAGTEYSETALHSNLFREFLVQEFYELFCMILLEIFHTGGTGTWLVSAPRLILFFYMKRIKPNKGYRKQLAVAPQAPGLASRLEFCHLSLEAYTIYLKWVSLHRNLSLSPPEVYVWGGDGLLIQRRKLNQTLVTYMLQNTIIEMF